MFLIIRWCCLDSSNKNWFPFLPLHLLYLIYNIHRALVKDFIGNFFYRSHEVNVADVHASLSTRKCIKCIFLPNKPCSFSSQFTAETRSLEYSALLVLWYCLSIYQLSFSKNTGFNNRNKLFYRRFYQRCCPDYILVFIVCHEFAVSFRNFLLTIKI